MALYTLKIMLIQSWKSIALKLRGLLLTSIMKYRLALLILSLCIRERFSVSKVTQNRNILQINTYINLVCTRRISRIRYYKTLRNK